MLNSSYNYSDNSLLSMSRGDLDMVISLSILLEVAMLLSWPCDVILDRFNANQSRIPVTVCKILLNEMSVSLIFFCTGHIPETICKILLNEMSVSLIIFCTGHILWNLARTILIITKAECWCKYSTDNLGCTKMKNLGKEELYKSLVLIVGAN